MSSNETIFNERQTKANVELSLLVAGNTICAAERDPNGIGKLIEWVADHGELALWMIHSPINPALRARAEKDFDLTRGYKAMAWALGSNNLSFFYDLMRAGANPVECLSPRVGERGRASELPGALFELYQEDPKLQEALRKIGQWLKNNPDSLKGFEKALPGELIARARADLWMERPGVSGAGEKNAARAIVFFSTLVELGSPSRELEEALRVARLKAAMEPELSWSGPVQHERQKAAMGALERDDAELFEAVRGLSGLSEPRALNAPFSTGKGASCNWLASAVKQGAWECAIKAISWGADPWLMGSDQERNGRGNPVLSFVGHSIGLSESAIDCEAFERAAQAFCEALVNPASHDTVTPEAAPAMAMAALERARSSRFWEKAPARATRALSALLERCLLSQSAQVPSSGFERPPLRM